MKCRWLCFVYWCHSVITTGGGFRVDGHSCFTEYWNSITCVLNITVNPMEQSNTTDSLHLKGFIYNSSEVTCPLVPKNHIYIGDCQIEQNELRYKIYTIQVCSKSRCQSLMEEFKPSQNIRPKAPHGLEIHKTPEAINITWKSGYEGHRYLHSHLKYELLLQKLHSNEGRINEVQSKSISIPREKLEEHAPYCTKVRSKPFEELYQATWSKWSSQICWEGYAKEEEDNILITLISSLGPVVVTVGLLLFVFFSPWARMKMNNFSIPSPAPFFKPLFQHHEGNIQEWLSPKGNFATLTHKSDDILITTIVSIEPKSTANNSGEDQDSCNSSVTPLALTECQNSYVCVPEMHAAPHLVTIISPNESPYTRLPCSVWGRTVGEDKIVSSLTQDFLQTGFC